MKKIWSYLRIAFISFIVCSSIFLFLFLIDKAVESENKKEFISEESLGIIKSAEVIPTAFNESTKTQINTEKGTVVVYRILSFIPVGEEAFVIKYKDKKGYIWRYISWEDSDYEYRF